MAIEVYGRIYAPIAMKISFALMFPTDGIGHTFKTNRIAGV